MVMYEPSMAWSEVGVSRPTGIAEVINIAGICLGLAFFFMMTKMINDVIKR